MSRFRNADQSQIEFQIACTRYESRYRPLLDETRSKYANNPAGIVRPDADEALEVHTREYLINALLYALNWRLDCDLEEGLPSLIPETPIASTKRETTRFLDYLGFERETRKPLLIVEAKRLNSPLPQRKDLVPEDKYRTPTNSLPYVICEGLCGASLVGDWNKWLDSLRDYVCSARDNVGYAPRRVVITNGNWLVLFADPTDAFLTQNPNPTKIVVWQDRSAIDEGYAELFQWLEYSSVSRNAPHLSVEELPFCIGPQCVDRVMHGLRILYIEVPDFYQPSPMIKVLPILFLRSSYGNWICIEEPSKDSIQTLPHSYEDLPKHLDRVEELGTELLRRVNKVLGLKLTSYPATAHYDDSEIFDERVGVERVDYRSDERASWYLVVTGSNTHYLLPQPSVVECPYHDWLGAQEKSAASNPDPVIRRRVHSPRSFFKSGETHHCAHSGVTNAKTNPITSDNLEQCGPRSGKPGQAFCEIARFEERLCCRACAFEDVCTKSPIFHLPCRHTDG